MQKINMKLRWKCSKLCMTTHLVIGFIVICFWFFFCYLISIVLNVFFQLSSPAHIATVLALRMTAPSRCTLITIRLSMYTSMARNP